MRKKIVAGNWKMNKTLSEALELSAEIVDSSYNKNTSIILIPPAIFISEIIKITKNTTIKVGVQNSSEYDNGAYTGELSATIIQSVGVEYALVGHSERREYFNEENKILAQKVNQLLKNNITPIYCCGEMLPEREKNNHFNVVKTQLEEGLFHLDKEQISNCIIAYEPVWAIGTGLTASSEQTQEMHQYIRGLLSEKYGQDIAESISILYGGSCNPANAKELFANKDVDGGLIGGASLVAENFIAITNSF